MNLAFLQTALEPLGWRRTADALESPSKGVWLTEASLDPSSLCALYVSMARRAESALRHGDVAASDEFRALLRTLGGELQVQEMLTLHDAAHSVFEPWAAQHGMALRLWDLSRASIRAEARHPSGGVACVEWISEEPKAPLLFLYHWVDEPARRRRMSWRATIDALEPPIIYCYSFLRWAA